MPSVYVLQLKETEVNFILSVLKKLPYEQVDQIITKILAQGRFQDSVSKSA